MNTEISTKNWEPDHEPFDYPKDFVEWINSINRGWDERTTYKKFESYKAQARAWLDQEDDISDFDLREHRNDYVRREILRCKANTMYLMNKYVWVQEGEAKGGRFRYESAEAQNVIMYLFDCKYSFLLMKPRQIWASTTIGGCFMKRANFNNGYMSKYIADEKSKAEGLFVNKIRYPWSNLPDWMRKNAYNYRDNVLGLGKNPKKNPQSNHSRIEVAGADTYGSTGFAPNLIGYDEIGMNDKFGSQIREMKPAMYRYDHKTKKLVIEKQMIAWGTGGKMEKGGAVLRDNWNKAKTAWLEGKFKKGYLIPIFMDYMARPGMTKTEYNDLRDEAYSTMGNEREEAIVQFHQHYPASEDDVFMKGSNTIIPMRVINNHIERINSLEDEDKPRWGRFEPVYDRNRETPEFKDTPYKIIGADFKELEPYHGEATAIIFKMPEGKWKNRYYQGTDPINASSGRSKMASAIWDNYTNTVPAIVNHRETNYKQTFLQCQLLNLFYSENKGCKELIEKNIGEHYYDWKEMRGFGQWVVGNGMLPKHMQTGSARWGIDKRSNTAVHIIHKLKELLDGYGDNIYIREFFMQLKTFVEKINDKGNSRWQADDYRINFDDVIDAVTYAYLNGQIHSRWEPELIEDDSKDKIEKKYIRDGSGYLRLVTVKNGKVIRR